MKVGIHGKSFSKDNHELISSILGNLKSRPIEIYFSDLFLPILKKASIDLSDDYNVYKKGENLAFLDYIITLGGDGTMLETVTHINGLDIPMLGINTGHMGFLATISKENVDKAMDDLFEGNYDIDRRSLLQLDSSNKFFEPYNFALNDFTILKTDSASMIKVTVYVNGEFLNTYWADGVIVATPTGSTGYSLSCGGPLIVPGTKGFVITPVSPHNLTARPMIVPDNSELTFKIGGRSDNFLLSLDSRSQTIERDSEFSVKKADFEINLVRLKGSSYFKTIRNKLSWGVDIRN